MKTSYGERDYPFGEKMLTLRTAIGLTQVELAHYLGISRRAVGEWEAGGSYPKVDHLKELITLGVEHQAFATGSEAEEIRQLWKTARQKVLLDEQWLSALLYQQRSRPLPIVSPPLSEKTRSRSSIQASSTPEPRVDWGDALAVPAFYGREEEQAQLIQWVVQERCRVVSVLGMGGIGKSALSVSLMYQISGHFEVVIFRPLRDTPSCETLLDACLQVLSREPIRSVPTTLEQRISLFLEHLRKTRALVVLDNLESLLQEGDVRGALRPGFLGYRQLLQRVAGTAHQSCLLLTSREKLADLRLLEAKHSHSAVRSLRLTALDRIACQQLLEEKELIGTEEDAERLIQMYGGNPLALKIVGETIFDLFGGEIGPFLAGGTVIFGSITALLSEQFGRLSPLERSVLCWLAIVRESVTLDELLALQITPLPRVHLLEAIDAGYRRSLIERGKRSGSFTLQSVVLEYVTEVLIAEASREIQQGQLARLIEHGLSQAQAREYVRETQEQLLLSPLLADLQSAYPRRATRAEQTAIGTGASSLPPPTATTEEQLLTLLDELREQEETAQGYGPANLIALLRLLRGDLSGLDLSQLRIRGAYLQSIEMHDTKLTDALIRDVVWTEAISATWVVAISRDGRWWAAGGMQGNVRIWDEEGQTLHLIQAHTDMVMALAFSPDGRTLGSGSLDDTVKLWDVESGALLWIGWQIIPQCLAFSPDSSLLASGGLSAAVRLWDAQNGVNLQTLMHPSYVLAVAWSPDGRLFASGCIDGQIRLWEKQNTTTGAEILQLSTSWVTSPLTNLAFAPSGTILASGSYDWRIRLWEVPSGRLFQALPGQTDQTMRIAWSPDGRTLACSSYDKAIWLWDVEQSQYRLALHGHTADVYGMAFTPDGSRLLSGGAENALRVWDIQNGQCLHIVAGYGVSLYDVDWSPDGRHLVSGSSDAVVTIWDVSGKAPSRALHGHSWFAWGVGWSPDGRLLASSSWDTTLRLWDPTSRACVQVFQGTSFSLHGMAWSPDGNLLACASLQQGIQVWDVTTRRLRWVKGMGLTINRVAWSPDGTRLVGGTVDNRVYLWDGTDGTQLQRLAGHQSKVMSVGWSPDGRLVASGGGTGGSGELFIWDVSCQRASPSGERVQTFAGHPGIVYALVWSPGGDRLISGGSDGKLRWWDVESGACVRTRDVHEGTILSLRVSRDGKRLASCGHDGAIMIWDLESGEHLRTLRRDRPYERLNITGIRGLTEAQKKSLRVLGAIEEVVP